MFYVVFYCPNTTWLIYKSQELVGSQLRQLQKNVHYSGHTLVVLVYISVSLVASLMFYVVLNDLYAAGIENLSNSKLIWNSN